MNPLPVIRLKVCRQPGCHACQATQEAAQEPHYLLYGFVLSVWQQWQLKLR